MPAPLAALAARLLPLAMGVGESGGLAAIARAVTGRGAASVAGAAGAEGVGAGGGLQGIAQTLLGAGAGGGAGAGAGAGAGGAGAAGGGGGAAAAGAAAQDVQGAKLAARLERLRGQYSEALHGTGRYQQTRDDRPLDWHMLLGPEQGKIFSKIQTVERRIARRSGGAPAARVPGRAAGKFWGAKEAEKRRASQAAYMADFVASAMRARGAGAGGGGGGGGTGGNAAGAAAAGAGGGGAGVGAGGGGGAGGPPGGGGPPPGTGGVGESPEINRVFAKTLKPFLLIGGTLTIANTLLIRFWFGLSAATKKLGDLAEKTVESNRGLSQWSGAIAASFANLDLQREAEERKLAQGTAGSAATLNRAFGEFVEETRQLRQFGRQTANLLGIVAANTGRIVAAMIKFAPNVGLLMSVMNKLDQLLGNRQQQDDPINAALQGGVKAGLNRPIAPLGIVAPPAAPGPQQPKPPLPPMPGGR